ncbi:hypothetical protein GCM10023091_03260 [Ravibacter arvi]|uniref:Lipid A biosynthesis acyltransferase n=2 Tax=Ravibacter arvi TaxID=2051041 RepID=A0ABP8LP75_9BACT
MVSAYYRHISDLCIEPILFYTAPASLRKSLTTFENTCVLDDLYRLRRNVVLLASHYGNWEYLINLPSQTAYTVSSGYSPAKNKVVDRLLRRIRSRFGVNLIPKHLLYRRSIELLQQNDRRNIVVLIADQRPAPDSRKHRLTFLGLETDVQIGAERMARHTNAAVVMVESMKVTRFKYHYRFELLGDQPVDAAYSLAITTTYFKRLENSIRSSPVYWLWSHDRWKDRNQPSTKA